MIDLDAIKDHYRAALPLLMEASDEWGIDPYAWDELGIRLTPIEAALWDDIRAADLVMYPQFPVSGYFVDFGNPSARVAIECDGKRWHQDKEHDAIRQQHIEAKGWTVYRITGKNCFQEPEVFEDEHGTEYALPSPARVFIQTIAERHPVQRSKRPAPLNMTPIQVAFVARLERLLEQNK